tara:strand:- start:372 stop:542 length:171 start_codon:yes stop_codon:yes gene_type:complete
MSKQSQRRFVDIEESVSEAGESTAFVEYVCSGKTRRVNIKSLADTALLKSQISCLW